MFLGLCAVLVAQKQGAGQMSQPGLLAPSSWSQGPRYGRLNVVSEDGRLLVISQADKSLTVADLATGKLLFAENVFLVEEGGKPYVVTDSQYAHVKDRVTMLGGFARDFVPVSRDSFLGIVHGVPSRSRKVFLVLVHPGVRGLTSNLIIGTGKGVNPVLTTSYDRQAQLWRGCLYQPMEEPDSAGFALRRFSYRTSASSVKISAIRDPKGVRMIASVDPLHDRLFAFVGGLKSARTDHFVELTFEGKRLRKMPIAPGSQVDRTGINYLDDGQLTWASSTPFFSYWSGVGSSWKKVEGRRPFAKSPSGRMTIFQKADQTLQIDEAR